MKTEKLFCATVLYPFTENESFDFDLYTNVLAPRYAEILGNNCPKFEVRKGLNSPGAPAAQFLCIASFWIKDRGEFGASLADPRMKDLMHEISSFTKISPIRQFDEVLL
jgi:hypothetical protein